MSSLSFRYGSSAVFIAASRSRMNFTCTDNQNQESHRFPRGQFGIFTAGVVDGIHATEDLQWSTWIFMDNLRRQKVQYEK